MQPLRQAILVCTINLLTAIAIVLLVVLASFGIALAPAALVISTTVVLVITTPGW